MRMTLALLLLLSTVGSADAQYFGRNKVRYDHRDLLVLQTPHFDIYYDTTEGPAVQLAARMAERWYERLSRTFDHALPPHQPIVLYGSHSKFSQTSIIPGIVGDGVGGFTDHFAGRVVLPFAAGLRDTDHVLGHELVHAFQRDILREQKRSLSQLPLWFSEGMAEYFSVGRLDPNTTMWLRDAQASGPLPTIKQLDNPRWFPYRYGQAFWQFIADQYSEQTVVQALRSRAPKGAAGRLRAVTGQTPAALSDAWHAYIRKTAPLFDAPMQSNAHALVSATRNGGHLNVGPRLSPDGRYLVFLSERDGMSVDMFLADGATGRVLRKLVSTAVDAHFDSLQFIDSAGAWHPSSGQFVYASVRDGRPVLTVVQIPSGKVSNEIVVPDIDQILSPAWSPDGQRIAFSGMRGGLTDLFTLDIVTGAVTQLTSDPYSDLQPSWSPDGHRLVFSSDRFSSSPDALLFGEYQLVALDLESRVVRLVAARTAAKAIDPQWAPDGTHIYFVSDEGGVSNVHRVDLASGDVEQLTRVGTGVTGVTALSPSISIGADGRQLALSMYSRGAYELWAVPLDGTSPASDRRAVSRPVSDRVATMPIIAPGARASGATSAASRTSLFPSSRYVPRLSLAQIGTPYLSAGGGALGSFLRGGISVGFSDLMGEQDLGAAIQVGKESTDNAVVLSYANRRRRWNWGVSGGRIPALVGVAETLQPETAADGTTALVRRNLLAQQIHRQASGFVSYPFSRAQRIEASVGVDAIAFDQRVTTTSYAIDTRLQMGDPSVAHSGGASATVVQTGAALVYDTAIAGPTSPVLGQRYRFGVSQASGDVSVFTTTADYRRYFMPFRPFTLAVRGMAVARLGSGAADSRLLPLVWNLRELVRGYDTSAATLATSRLSVGNVELRLPLTSLRSQSGGALPVELFAFSDCGRFWTPEGSAFPATSACAAGGGARINAAGFVFEFNLARPLVGVRDQGWRFGVAFQPGF